MTEEAQKPTPDSVVTLASEIVAAYVSNNPVPRTDLPALIADIHAAIGKLGSGSTPEPETKLIPAVPVKKSVTPDYIVCLDDGKKFKSLKRHLATHHGLTPDEYRQRWGLPRDYPIVAPAYAAARSTLAKSMGLGRKKVAESPKSLTVKKQTRAPRKAAATTVKPPVATPSRKPATKKKAGA